MTCLQHLQHSLACTAWCTWLGWGWKKGAKREKGKRVPWWAEHAQHHSPWLPIDSCPHHPCWSSQPPVLCSLPVRHAWIPRRSPAIPSWIRLLLPPPHHVAEELYRDLGLSQWYKSSKGVLLQYKVWTLSFHLISFLLYINLHYLLTHCLCCLLSFPQTLISTPYGKDFLLTHVGLHHFLLWMLISQGHTLYMPHFSP